MATMGAVALGAAFAPGGAADSDLAVSPVVFDTCGTKAWTVPAGVTSVTAEVSGAAGGDGNASSTPMSLGGRGGRSSGTLVVTPGEVLTVVVGCAGAPGSDVTAVGGSGDGSGGDGPSNGDPTENGATAGGGGGGGSSVSRGSSRLLVAGGGGGGAPSAFDTPGSAPGGAGGGANQDGADGTSAGCGDGGLEQQGHGATTSGPGSASSGSYPGAAGIGTDGGDGGTAGATFLSAPGGAGGGGYFGGGGGAGSDDGQTCGGGGGGSGFADPEVTAVSFANGVQAGDGRVELTFASPSTAPSAVLVIPRFAG